MDARLPAVADQLLLIERELRLLGWWGSVMPAEERLASQEPFCLDSLALEEWLQWIFLPRMKAIIEQGVGLPGACAIQPMAEQSWRAEGARVAALLALLAEFDRLINTAA
ncbi:YqcC family protein [Geopseudomonas aromaticivorans]